jgi:hypothetical protein
MKTGKPEGLSSDTELLRAIQDGLVATYRDVLRQPIPDSVRVLLARLDMSCPDLPLRLAMDHDSGTAVEESVGA